LAEVGEIGEVCFFKKMDNLEKYYQAAANAMFGGGDTKVVKANETLSFEARESRPWRQGESGCGNNVCGADGV
jgi:peptide/nickel transport system ATP-binding protein